MIRLVVILLASVLLITVLRAVIGIIMKGFGDMLSGSDNTPAPKSEVPLAGELKRDPVCGTYVSTNSSIKKTLNGEVVHFCSVDCRDKHKV